MARRSACRDYHAHGRAVAGALAREHGASLADIADVLWVSRWEGNPAVGGVFTRWPC